MKLLFIPFSVIGGLLSGFLAKKLFEQAWGVVDEEEPPKPNHREVPFGKIVAAAALEGAIFKGTRAVIDTSHAKHSRARPAPGRARSAPTGSSRAGAEPEGRWAVSGIRPSVSSALTHALQGSNQDRRNSGSHSVDSPAERGAGRARMAARREDTGQRCDRSD